MNKIVFQIIGGFVLFLGASLLFAGILVLAGYSPRHYPSGSLLAFSAGLIILVGVLCTTGLGLLTLRRWAGLAVSILGLCLAFLAAWTALHVSSKADDENWLSLLYVPLFIFPSFVTMKYWHTLVWRKPKIPAG